MTEHVEDSAADSSEREMYWTKERPHGAPQTI